MCELTPSSLDRLAHNLHVQVSFEPVAINLFVFGLTSCCIVTITDDSNKLRGHRNVFALTAMFDSITSCVLQTNSVTHFWLNLCRVLVPQFAAICHSHSAIFCCLPRVNSLSVSNVLFLEYCFLSCLTPPHACVSGCCVPDETQTCQQ